MSNDERKKAEEQPLVSRCLVLRAGPGGLSLHVVIRMPPPPPPSLSTGPPAAADGSHDFKRLRMEGGGAVRADDVAGRV